MYSKAPRVVTPQNQKQLVRVSSVASAHMEPSVVWILVGVAALMIYADTWSILFKDVFSPGWHLCIVFLNELWRNIPSFDFKYRTTAPPCGRMRDYTGSFTTEVMNGQDMSVLFHCAAVNFAPMSTFLKAAGTNKEMCLRSVKSFCVPWMVTLSTQRCSHES